LQGELAQAKNGDELFWEDKSHAANWKKAQACTQGALLYSFKVSGGKDFFFHFPLVHNVFPLCSLQVPNVFPNILSIDLTFIPCVMATLNPPFTYIGGPKERSSVLQNKTFYFGEPP